MRILLAHNSLYYPSFGGGDKSNRLLMEALAERKHEVRVVSRVEVFGKADGEKLLDDLETRRIRPRVIGNGIVFFALAGVQVHVVAFESNIRLFFSKQLHEFDPDIVITSTDDPGQLLFDLALKAPRARVVHLIRATVAVPFGPDSSSANASKTELLRHADGVVGVSNYVADYARRFGGLAAVHVPISLLESGFECPYLARFDSPCVSMVNPCAVKGISIFLELADRMPNVRFAAVPTWGTNHEDFQALAQHSNITVLPPMDAIDDLLQMTRVLLVPSVWAEARSRIVVEAMSRGVPVIASNVGGIPEAHLGVDYLLPVNQIERYRPSLDGNLVPVAEVPPQNVSLWQSVLERLLTDRPHWEDLSRQSHETAREYVGNLSVEPFESYLTGLTTKPKNAPCPARLSEDKRKLLAARLKQRGAPLPASPQLLVGQELLKPGDTALICLPWAGGGTMLYRRWREGLQDVAVPVSVRLPGREDRIGEASFRSMEEVIKALGPAVQRTGFEHPLALFGHSMGAGIAFELTRWLIRQGSRPPVALIVSSARAPQFRIAQGAAPDPNAEELLTQLRAMGGIPAEVLENPEALRLLVPLLEADTRLYRHWQWQSGERLPVPIFAYGGAADPGVDAHLLEGWREQTSARFLRREFPGGHFYLLSPESGVVDAMRSDLMHG